MADLDAVGWLWFSVPVLGSVSTWSGLSCGISVLQLFMLIVLAVCCIGQLFYAWRIWILSHRLWITAVIFLVSCLSVFSIFPSTLVIILPRFLPDLWALVNFDEHNPTHERLGWHGPA